MYEMNAFLEDLIFEMKYAWRELKHELYSACTLEDVTSALVGTPLLNTWLNLINGEPLLKFEPMESIVSALEFALDDKMYTMTNGCYWEI